MFFYFDPWWFILILPTMMLGLFAQIKVQSTYKKFSTVFSRKGNTASAVARRILDKNGLYDVRIERVRGDLTDHFDPGDNVVRLSDKVHDSTSVAAIGVAAHEVGHAIQHATAYKPMKFRTAIIPVTRIGSMLAPILIILGAVALGPDFAMLGIILYSTTAVFQLATLPVEFNASRRALETLDKEALLDRGEEMNGAKSVLSAAAMTYVAALIMSLAQILRLLLIFGGRRD